MSPRIVSPYVRLALLFRPTHKEVQKIQPERRLLDYEIFIVEKGGGFITIESTEVPVKEGDLILIPPGVKHFFSFTGGVYPYAHFDLFYNENRHKSYIVSGGQCEFTSEDQALMQPFIFENQKDFPYRVSLVNVDFYLDKFYQLIDLYAEMPIFCEEQMQKLILELLDPFFANVQNNKAHQVTTDIDVKLQKAIMYIRAHLYCKISLSELSKVAALSDSHLSHQFKANFGVGPIAYHRRCRLQGAADQMTRTNRSIQEIAFDYGFDNSLNFSRAFKEEFNMAPKFYRAEQK